MGILCNGKMYWGAGLDEDIIKSSIAALVSAGNKMAQSENIKEGREERIVDIMRYVQTHYKDVTLEELSAALGVPVIPVENDGGALLRAMCQL